MKRITLSGLSGLSRYLLIVLWLVIAGLGELCARPGSGFDSEVRGVEKQLETARGMKRIELLVQLVRFHEEREPVKTLKYGREALDLLRSNPAPHLRVEVINFMCMAYMDLGNNAAADDYAKNSMELAEAGGNPESIAGACLVTGRLQWRKGETVKASGLLSRSLSIYQKLGNQLGIARVKNIMGLIYWRMGDYTRAIELLLDSFSIYERMGNKTWIPRLLNNIAIIYFEIKDFRKSAQFFQKALEYHRQHTDRAGESRVLNNLALLLAQQEKFDEALILYNRSIKIKKELGIKGGLAASLANIGSIYEKKKQYDKALEYYRQSLDISNSIKDRSNSGHVLVNTGRIYRKTGKPAKAAQYVEEALALTEKYNHKKEKANALEELSKIYPDLGDHHKALECFKRFKRINDTLFNADTGKTINELHARYNVRLKEEKIELLEQNHQIEQLALDRERSLTYSLIAASLIILVLVVWFYYSNRLGHRFNKELRDEVEQHRETMKKLRANEEEFRQLAEKSILGIMILQDMKIRYANPRILNLLGYSLQEFLERPPLEFISQQDRERVGERLKQRMKGIQSSQWFEFTVNTRDGHTRYIESHTDEISFLGEPALMASLVDVTDRKNTEAELLKSRKLESIGILAGGIAHDFNNLLSIIVGYIEMLKDDFEPGSPRYDRLVQMGTAAQQAADLCRNLSIFSRKAHLMFKKIELPVIIDKVLEIYPELKPRIKEIQLPPDLRDLCGDERHILQVMSNLMVNALEAEPGDRDEHVSISVSADNVNLDEDNEFGLEKRQYVNITITDNGAGFPPELKKRVFEPFYSTKTPEDSPRTTGVGLGLPICYSIVHRHGGEITITSQPGAGTTVMILLPAYVEEMEN